MFYTYVLEDEKGQIYFGFTKDLRKRLQEHNQGATFSTKGRKWHCIYYEACLNEEDARRRELYLKTTQGGRLLKRRLKEYLYGRRAS
jgi:putative endonuclease